MKINVGRKATNEINFPDDQHLSNIHSTFYQVEGVWYIEDLGTTNGYFLYHMKELGCAFLHKLSKVKNSCCKMEHSSNLEEMLHMSAKRLVQIEKLRSKNRINVQFVKSLKKIVSFCRANTIYVV